MIFVIMDNVVELWLLYYLEWMYYDELEFERVYGWIVEVCLEYFLIQKVQEMVVEFCGWFKDFFVVVLFFLKDMLLLYVVQFWIFYYSKVGGNRLFEKVKEFF